LQHQVFDQHLFDAAAKIGLGHKREARFCLKLRERSNEDRVRRLSVQTGFTGFLDYPSR
jgi:hypothetical protein